MFCQTIIAVFLLWVQGDLIIDILSNAELTQSPPNQPGGCELFLQTIGKTKLNESLHGSHEPSVFVCIITCRAGVKGDYGSFPISESVPRPGKARTPPAGLLLQHLCYCLCRYIPSSSSRGARTKASRSGSGSRSRTPSGSSVELSAASSAPDRCVCVRRKARGRSWRGEGVLSVCALLQ